MIGVDVETLSDDIVDKVDEAKGEFLGVKILDVSAETLRNTMVENLAEVVVELLGPKPVTVNAERVGEAIDDRLVEVYIGQVTRGKLVDVEDKTMLAVDFVTFCNAMIYKLAEKEDEYFE